MTAFLGIVGAGFILLAYDALDKSGARVAVFSVLGLLCFGVMIAGMPTHSGTYGCYIDWDGRANSEVCD